MVEENFEAPFDEQIKYIRTEDADQLDLDALPEALSEKPTYRPFCFKYPQPVVPAATPAEILANLTWLPESRKRSAAVMSLFTDEKKMKGLLLRGLTSAGNEAAARILAILVCAEESAVNIFFNECKRLEENKMKANRRALQEIESEERVHDWLIQQARSYYPTTEDMNAIRRRTRRLFMRVASRDFATHFARISGLDSGVCICLTALLGSKTVTGVEGFATLLRHIRRDEASHVKKARSHAAYLGFDASGFGDAYDLTRGGIVKMLEPISGSFETMGVDPDRLYKRLLRFQARRSTIE